MPVWCKRCFLTRVMLIISLLVFPAFGFMQQEKERVKLKNPTADELSELCSTRSLNKLIIKGRVDAKLPDCFQNLKELREIELNNINSNLDFSSISQSKSLEVLRLKHFEISKLPDFVLNIHSLRFLDLSGTEIKNLPYGLEFLESIDMRMIELNREQQEIIREQYPNTEILFSSPCQCG